jgi:hypothetical protein
VRQDGCWGGKGGGVLTSEEVHEVLRHIAVGREDLADARGALGPRLTWRALDSIGHPLQQALTCKTPECGYRREGCLSAKAGPRERPCRCPRISLGDWHRPAVHFFKGLWIHDCAISYGTSWLQAKPRQKVVMVTMTLLRPRTS